jgi:hypothetical protein
MALLHDDHESAIKACARTATVAYLKSHSPGLTEWLRKTAGLSAPEPQLPATAFVATHKSFSEGLDAVLQGYAAARRGTFTGTHPINAVFHGLTQSLESSDYIKAFPTLRVRFSTGQGNWARVPWIAILDERNTTTTQSGVYCVYLFREDGSGVYLCLAQGVTEPQRRLGAAEGKAELRERAGTIRPSLGSLAEVNFSLADDIDLKSGPGLGSDYEASVIAHKLYERDAVPDDEQLFADLNVLINSYEQTLSSTGVAADPAIPPRELLRAFSSSLKAAGLDYGSRHDTLCAPRSWRASCPSPLYF